jgi:hypothetical protein
VADSSLAIDSGPIMKTYAARPSGLLDHQLPKRRIEVYTEPSGPADAPAYS